MFQKKAARRRLFKFLVLCTGLAAGSKIR
ncbi:MAG: hypothetical protein JWP22_428, partial [Ramlibacter sp.]|nr:hypothetical protein [Ramlibacter sp.]